MSNAYDQLIAQAAKKYAIQPALIKAVIKAESWFDPRAFRAEPQIKDASRGLMQILAGTAKWMGYGGPIGNDQTRTGGLYDPAINIEFGTKFLQYLRNNLGGDLLAIISGYNAGPGNAKRNASGRFPNQGYVDKVFRYYREFGGAPQREASSLILLQPHAPQLGPVPSSPAQIAIAPDSISDVLASTFQGSNPWVLGGAALLALSLLFPPRRRR